MNISIRLLFLLAFCAFILPKIFFDNYDATIGQQKKMEDTYNQLDATLSDKENDRKKRLSRFIDGLNIRDKELNNCISNQVRNQFLYSKKTIDTLIIENLDCSRRGIKSISGISNLTKLKVLLLDYNDINDVEELANLPNLERVDLSLNKNLRDISSLNSIYSLKQVQLPSNGEVSCREVQSLMDDIVSRHGDAYRAPIPFCAGSETREITKILKKKQRGQTLSSNEKRILQSYNQNKIRRY